MKVLTPEPKLNGAFVGIELDDAKKTRSDALADALGELSGKRLDRPTAHSLGKLFQKRLVGRPAWIQDGETIAILRKSTGHDENSYWVDVSVPGQAPDLRPCSHRSRSARTFPTIPTFPGRRRAEEGKAGNVGKDGNVSRRATQQDGKTFGGRRHGECRLEHAVMSAIAALKAARAAGVRLKVEGDDLVLEASAAPPSAVLDLLSLNKSDIITILRRQRLRVN